MSRTGGRTSALELTRHPATPASPVGRIVVQADRPSPDALTLRYTIEGELSRLRIPAPAAPRRGERLWEHTCCEAFVAAPGSAAYHELNLSPAGTWAVHAFVAYRDGGPLADDALAPRIASHADAGRLVLDAVVDLARLDAAYAGAPLRLALAAVIEAQDGTLSYWALRHPAGRPDFHHADGFTVIVPPPAAGAGADAR